MRFRRETGDFSIRLMVGENPGDISAATLPKGLSAEEFLGVFAYIDGLPEEAFGVSNLIIPVTFVSRGDYYSVVTIVLGATPITLFYDPATGNLGTTPPPAPAGSEVILIATTADDAYLAMFCAEQPCAPSDISVGATVTLVVSDEAPNVIIPAPGTYTGTITETTPVTENTVITYGRNKTVLVPAGSVGCTVEYVYDTDGDTGQPLTESAQHIYYDPVSGIIGHAALVFSNNIGDNSGGSSV